MADTLLPPPLASDPSLRVLEALGDRLFDLPREVVLTCLIDLVDASALPHLAWQWSLLDEPIWSLVTTDQDRRELIKNAVELHRYKGTPWAIKRALELVGQPGATLIEGRKPSKRGAGLARGSGAVRAPVWGWATYRVRLTQPITTQQAQLIVRMLASVGRASCKLERLEYPAYLLRGAGYVRGAGWARGAIIVTEDF